VTPLEVVGEFNRGLCLKTREETVKRFFLALLIIPLLSLPVKGNWISLGGPPGQPPEITILEDGPEGTTIDFQIPGYYLDTLYIEGEPYTVISLPEIATFLNQGWPMLPRISESIIIPDDARMSYQILQSEYEDRQILPVVPSKGSLLRSVNPDTIPYTFSDSYQVDTWWPEELVELSQPFILRDFRGITLQFSPFQHNAVQESLRVCKHLVARVYPDGPGEVNVKTRPRDSISKEFSDVYANFFLNFSEAEWDTIAEAGKMLIIAADDFCDNMLPLVEWKLKKGVETELARCSDVGENLEAVRAYIQAKYDTEGVTFNLLVGDGNLENVATSITVPYAVGDTGRAKDQPADPVYTYLEGDDLFPDAFISRFSAQTPDDVDNQVIRTINYERYPQSGSSWYYQGTGIASCQGEWSGAADSTRCNWLREDLLSYTYTWVDRIYDPWATASLVANALNDGRSIVNYIGHGGYDHWSTSSFYSSDVYSLENSNMLPFIISVACVNGAFVSRTCFAEAWLRAGSVESPKGAIAFYGSSIPQRWVEPCVGQAAAVDLLTQDRMNTVGGILFNGACEMIEDYLPGITGVDQFQTWHIFGDASVQVRTDTPQPLVVSHPHSYQIGPGSFTVSTGDPNAMVCLWKENEGYHQTKFTDATGEVTFNTSFASAGPLEITVTRYNRLPYEATVLSGPLTQSQTWPKNVFVFGDVTVPSGITLTVESGTKVRFTAGADHQGSGADPSLCELIVEGTLNALGDPYRIYLSSDAGPGNWYGIRVKSGGRATIENAVIKDGYCGISFDSAQEGQITSCTIKGNLVYGIQGYATDDLHIAGNTIFGNHVYGVYTEGCSPSIIENSFPYPGQDHAIKVVGDTPERVMVISGNTISMPVLDCGDRLEDGASGVTVEYASPLIEDNVISGGSYGISGVGLDSTTLIKGSGELSQKLDRNCIGLAFYSGSKPTVSNNKISEYRDIGVACYESYPLLGDSFIPGTGNNSITPGSCPFQYAVYCEGVTDTIKAEMNWWGQSPPDPSWFYGLVDYDPWLTSVGVESTTRPPLPDQFSLSQNYPNPFNPGTEIKYALPKDCWVRLEVYNILGQRVATLVDGKQVAGYKVIHWDASRMASGVYIYRIRAGEFVQVRRMLLLK